MENKKPTIDDLLNSLQNPNQKYESKLKNLPNTSDTWERIGSRDKFSELGLESSELESFLKEWISENPYSNI